jgi:hypothetical protein
MSFPALGVVTDVGTSDAVAPLLQALFDRCHVVAWHPGLPVDAVFLASWRAPRALDASKEVGGRVVLWDDAGDPPPDDWRDRATITISTPHPAVDVRQFRALTPFMRERWRGRFEIGVPVEVPSGLSWRQQRTFLALCPAVVATGTTALHALAFATPLVTDGATARQLGGTDGVDMVVSDDSCSQKAALAEALGEDQRRAAAIGRAGRRLVEERHDLSLHADAVARALGWQRRDGRVAAHLGDLPTPPLSRPITRAEARVAELTRTQPMARTA